MGEGRQVNFMRLPIGLPCPVPVMPGTPDTMDPDGELLPLEDRTEACAVDAYWMIGAQISCDIHTRLACGLIGIDYDGLVAEGGGPFGSEDKPWAERHRYPQDQARKEAPRA